MPNEKTDDKQESPLGNFFATWRGWLLAALLIGGIIVAIVHWGDVKQFAKLLTEAKPIWLLIAALLQLGTYFGLAGQWWVVLRRGCSPEHVGGLFRLTFAKHFADQVVPTAGVSGNVLLVDRLVSMGVPRSNAVAALLLQIIAIIFPMRSVPFGSLSSSGGRAA